LETLSVYAPDDVEVAALVDAAPRERDERLTMIAVQKGYEIGRTAFELLHRRIQDPARPVHVQLIPAEILITGSGTGRRELRVPVDPVSIPNPPT
jgi:DNA-binding LacI/PurR family transcriptional regulator